MASGTTELPEVGQHRPTGGHAAIPATFGPVSLPTHETIE
jgi:hypothetical protein